MLICSRLTSCIWIAAAFRSENFLEMNCKENCRLEQKHIVGAAEFFIVYEIQQREIEVIYLKRRVSFTRRLCIQEGSGETTQRYIPVTEKIITQGYSKPLFAIWHLSFSLNPPLCARVEFPLLHRHWWISNTLGWCIETKPQPIHHHPHASGRTKSAHLCRSLCSAVCPCVPPDELNHSQWGLRGADRGGKRDLARADRFLLGLKEERFQIQSFSVTDIPIKHKIRVQHWFNRPNKI